MNVLITGSSGFIGGVLAEQCRTAGDRVLGLDIRSPDRPAAGTEFELCDVRSVERFHRVIAEFRPGRIYHLAAQSYPVVSMAKAWETFEVNAGGTVHLFESLRHLGLRPMVVVACSSAEYGPVASADLPVKEDHLLRPLHPYGVSKVAQDLLSYQYFLNYGIPAIRIRIFNTTGPSKVGDVCSDLTRRAAEIELGLRPPQLPMGNLTTRRALQDVRDLVRGLLLAAERGTPGDVYNIGGNAIYSVAELVETVRRRCRVPFTVLPDPALQRANDEPVIAGDSTKFHGLTGWTPEIEIEQTLAEMLAWWRERLQLDESRSPSLVAS